MSYQRFADVYDRLMADMPYAEWLQFLEDSWSLFQAGSPWEGLAHPESIVDLGCGTGNIALPLAQLGLQVTGIDLSANMLQQAEEKGLRSPSFKDQGGMLLWQQQDMRSFTVIKPVDMVISFCDCLNYITEEEGITQTFQRVYEALKEGGLFLFDVHTPNLLESYFMEQPFVLNEPDIAYIWTCKLDDPRHELTNELSFFIRESDASDAPYHKFTETHVQRGYGLKWLTQALTEQGFDVLACVADFTWEPADEESTERAFFVARKRN